MPPKQNKTKSPAAKEDNQATPTGTDVPSETPVPDEYERAEPAAGLGDASAQAETKPAAAGRRRAAQHEPTAASKDLATCPVCGYEFLPGAARF